MSAPLPVTVDPHIMGGAVVFAGTRVPAESLFDYLADGCTLDEFLASFPTVKRADAIKVLEQAKTVIKPEPANPSPNPLPQEEEEQEISSSPPQQAAGEST